MSDASALPRSPVRPSGSRRRRMAWLGRAFRRMTLALAVAALIWAGYEYWNLTRPVPSTEISGVVEADDVIVSAEIAGRLIALTVAEGQQVAAGTVVARLDDSRIRLQISLGNPAAQRELDLEADKYVLRAPRSGQVTRVVARAGEYTAPGQAVLVIADLAVVDVNLYVPLKDLGAVRVGQVVTLTADPYPGRTFQGVVSTINPKSEYTPRNVQSQRDRLNLVFGVKARVENRDGALLPGLPIRASILTNAPAE